MYFGFFLKSGLEQKESSRAYPYLLKAKNQSQTQRVSLALYKISVKGLN